jgi:hypothetical protein
MESKSRPNVQYIPLRKGICKEIDKVKSKAKDSFQEPKYRNRPDFVEKAVIEKLQKEGVEVLIA